MKFRRKPLLNTVRKKFAWLPHRMYEIRGKWISTGGPLVRYEQGWHYNSNFTNMTSPMARLRSTQRHVPAPVLKNEGMVTPVEMRPVNWYDHWIWFEWYLQALETDSHPGQWQGRTYWRHYPMPEQWNIWHEYD